MLKRYLSCLYQHFTTKSRHVCLLVQIYIYSDFVCNDLHFTVCRTIFYCHTFCELNQGGKNKQSQSGLFQLALFRRLFMSGWVRLVAGCLCLVNINTINRLLQLSNKEQPFSVKTMSQLDWINLPLTQSNICRSGLKYTALMIVK